MGRFVLLLLLVFGIATAGAASLEGKKAPALALKDPAGTPHTLREIANGRPAVVLFWASWCPYCKALMPPLAKIADGYGRDRIAVIAVDVWEDDSADARPVIEQGGFGFDYLMKGDRQTKAWGVKGTPGLFVVDRGGIVVYDRSARPVKAVPEGAPKSTPASSAEHWCKDVRAAIDDSLAAAAPAPAASPAG
jgi:thiol-disulfide isomerase/thioredoxin